jgi:signal recognition particle subunit SRP54
MMVGLQGSGKTTTTAKIAKRLTERQGKKVLMASLDTRRPARRSSSPDRRAGRRRHAADRRRPDAGADRPARRGGRALGGYDVVMLDTAGRTHIDEPLMAEMAEIRQVEPARDPARRRRADRPGRGQSRPLLRRARRHHRHRADPHGRRRRGGAALSMRAVTGKPIKLIGTGEKMDALEEFHPKRIANRILGMGDIVSLVEKAAETIDAEKAAAIAEKMRKGKFDLDDLPISCARCRRSAAWAASWA